MPVNRSRPKPQRQAEPVRALSAADFATVTKGLRAVMDFCFANFNGRADGNHGTTFQTILRRFVAIAWLLNSSALRRTKNARPCSLQYLAKLPQISSTRCTLSIHAGDFGKLFSFKSRIQKTVFRENYARSAVAGWKLRRERSMSK